MTILLLAFAITYLLYIILVMIYKIINYLNLDYKKNNDLNKIINLNTNILNFDTKLTKLNKKIGVSNE
jgi:hypothetical protein